MDYTSEYELFRAISKRKPAAGDCFTELVVPWPHAEMDVGNYRVKAYAAMVFVVATTLINSPIRCATHCADFRSCSTLRSAVCPLSR